MEDSSSNPYIDQDSEKVRKQIYKRTSPLGRIVKWSLILTILIIIGAGVGLYLIIPKTSVVDAQARMKLADTLQPPDQVLKRVSVESQLGFKLNYDNHIYSSYAEVGDSTSGTDSSSAIAAGQTYENNELRVTREYNYVRIRPIESVDTARALETLPPQLEVFATVTDKELTAAAAVPENKGLSKLSLFVKLDGDKRLAKRVADDKTVVTIDVSKPITTVVDNIEYQKVRYTTTNDNHRVSDVKYDECYYTIQYDQPYSICVTGVRPTNVSAASLAEQVFNSVTFVEQPKAVPAAPADASAPAASATNGKKASYLYPLARLAQATTTDASDTAVDDSTESPLLTVTPPYYKDGGSLSAVAMTQPSVVRIGTLYCADLALKFESGDTATTLTDACVGNVASGTFISKDGYIATTGHAIRTQKKAAIGGYINFAPSRDEMLDRLQRVLDYLLKAKIILQSDAEYLKTGASIGDQEALAKIENLGSVIPDKFITVVKDKYTYAIQPSDKPIVVNRSESNKPSFAYSDSVINADYVASSYDATKSIQEVFDSATPTVDTGLLKADGEFPDVPIAAKENVKSNDVLNMIGFPAYTDSSLAIDKIRNQPIATVGKVDQAYVKDGTRLIQTDTPVLPGSDGAPVVDDNGQLVGFAVYGLSYCPDKQCFSNGTVRSSAELLKLLDENNIKLTTGSLLATNWRTGVAEFMRSNYAASASAFALTTGYQFNSWADPVQKLAIAGQGTPSDTSLMNQLQALAIYVLAGSVIITILLTIAFVIHRRSINSLQVGHYGAAEMSQDVLRPQGPARPTQPMQPNQYGQPVQSMPAYPPVALPEVPRQNVMPGAVHPEQHQGNTTPIISIRNQPQNPSQGGFGSSNKPQSTPPEDSFYK
jgi:S1-C subfamily serine protease